MGFKCGIVGLPNVGKSTLFNALTSTAAAEAANYPFCTIEPNVGKVNVPDKRLETLASLASSKETIYTQLEFVDIAGLVEGASKGEGLGNQFLSHIREVDAIVHVLRCFADDNVTHVYNNVDPIRDADTIETELALADLEVMLKRKTNLEKKVRANDKEAKAEIALVEQIIPLLEEGKPVRAIDVNVDEHKIIKSFQLLTYKPIMYVCNVGEDDVLEGNAFSDQVKTKAEAENAACVIISSKIEEEISLLDNQDEKQEFLEAIGLEETGLNKVIRTGYTLLDLITFFTVGPKEAHAWTVRKHALAPETAGVIHTDFEKGFIRAEAISYDDYVNCGGEQQAKDAGKMRLEGKEYETSDGDIFHFRFNV